MKGSGRLNDKFRHIYFLKNLSVPPLSTFVGYLIIILGFNSYVWVPSTTLLCSIFLPVLVKAIPCIGKDSGKSTISLWENEILTHLMREEKRQRLAVKVWWRGLQSCWECPGPCYTPNQCQTTTIVAPT